MQDSDAKQSLISVTGLQQLSNWLISERGRDLWQHLGALKCPAAARMPFGFAVSTTGPYIHNQHCSSICWTWFPKGLTCARRDAEKLADVLVPPVARVASCGQGQGWGCFTGVHAQLLSQTHLFAQLPPWRTRVATDVQAVNSAGVWRKEFGNFKQLVSCGSYFIG